MYFKTFSLITTEYLDIMFERLFLSLFICDYDNLPVLNLKAYPTFYVYP